MSDVNVIQRTQHIIVNMANNSVSVINGGPIGPTGIPGEVTEAELTAALLTKVSKAGDTMTGPLILAADPVTNLGAATRQFVLANAGAGGGGSTNTVIDGGSPSSSYVGTVPIDGGTP